MHVLTQPPADPEDRCAAPCSVQAVATADRREWILLSVRET